MSEHKQLSIGIIGCGTVTQTSYASTFPAFPEAKVTHVFDLNEKNALSAAEKFGAVIAPLDEIRSKVGLIIIATPPGSHTALVREALTQGNIVVCEKPFVGKKSDADALIALAHERRSTLYVAHFRRMFPHAQLVRSLSLTGMFGRVTGLKIIEGGRFSWDAQSGYVMKDPLGGVLFDTGSHTIDMALFAAGLDETEMSVKVDSIQRETAEPSHEIKASFTFSTAEGKGNGSVHFSRFQVLANLITIEYERGSIQFSPGLINRIRITGPNGTSVIFPEYGLDNYAEPFAEQYRSIFSGIGAEVFMAARFRNLTNILESIANG